MIAAIDPGITGAIAYLNSGLGLTAIDDIPVDKVKVGKTMRSRINPDRMIDLLAHSTITTVVLEEVHAQGRNGSLANFSLGRSFGVIEAAIAANDLDLVLVKPRAWKKALGLTSDKNDSLNLARTLWPSRTYFDRAKDDGRAEAALIGHWYFSQGDITT